MPLKVVEAAGDTTNLADVYSSHATLFASSADHFESFVRALQLRLSDRVSDESRSGLRSVIQKLLDTVDMRTLIAVSPNSLLFFPRVEYVTGSIATPNLSSLCCEHCASVAPLMYTVLPCGHRVCAHCLSGSLSSQSQKESVPHFFLETASFLNELANSTSVDSCHSGLGISYTCPCCNNRLSIIVDSNLAPSDAVFNCPFSHLHHPTPSQSIETVFCTFHGSIGELQQHVHTCEYCTLFKANRYSLLQRMYSELKDVHLSLQTCNSRYQDLLKLVQQRGEEPCAVSQHSLHSDYHPSKASFGSLHPFAAISTLCESIVSHISESDAPHISDTSAAETDSDVELLLNQLYTQILTYAAEKDHASGHSSGGFADSCSNSTLFTDVRLSHAADRSLAASIVHSTYHSLLVVLCTVSCPDTAENLAREDLRRLNELEGFITEAARSCTLRHPIVSQQQEEQSASSDALHPEDLAGGDDDAMTKISARVGEAIRSLSSEERLYICTLLRNTMQSCHSLLRKHFTDRLIESVHKTHSFANQVTESLRALAHDIKMNTAVEAVQHDNVTSKELLSLFALGDISALSGRALRASEVTCTPLCPHILAIIVISIYVLYTMLATPSSCAVPLQGYDSYAFDGSIVGLNGCALAYLESDKTTPICFSCKDGFAYPGDGCRQSCDAKCRTCDPLNSTHCTQCWNSGSVAPACMPIVEGCPHEINNRCSKCSKGKCVQCIDGYANPSTNCTAQCFSVCRSCALSESLGLACTECRAKDALLPFCLPPGGCPTTTIFPSYIQKAYRNCARCDGAVCVACIAGFGNTALTSLCSVPCNENCRECSISNPDMCLICRNSSHTPPLCSPVQACPSHHSYASCASCEMVLSSDGSARVQTHCVSCKPGHTSPATNCSLKCHAPCARCLDNSSYVCAECTGDSTVVVPPFCLPPGKCPSHSMLSDYALQFGNVSDNVSYVHCAECSGLKCTKCIDGYSRPDQHCTVKCSTVCATCDPMNQFKCTSCAHADSVVPMCLEKDKCPSRLHIGRVKITDNFPLGGYRHCSKCFNTTCLECVEGHAIPEAFCEPECHPRCKTCATNNTIECLSCNPMIAGAILPLCYENKGCPKSLKSHCLTCEGFRCLSCKPTYTDTSSNCSVKCGSFCRQCEDHPPYTCIECSHPSVKPPYCLPKGMCPTNETAYSRCRKCAGNDCYECKDGFTDAQHNCTGTCHQLCHACSPVNASVCTACAHMDREPPFCLPAGVCSPGLDRFCSECNGSVCLSCNNGYTNVSAHCQEHCDRSCAVCHSSNASQCLEYAETHQFVESDSISNETMPTALTSRGARILELTISDLGILVLTAIITCIGQGAWARRLIMTQR